MNYAKNVKPVTGSRARKQKNPFVTAEPPADKHLEKSFFRFVDKHPLFRNNSRDAVLDVISGFHRGRVVFNPIADDDYDAADETFIGHHTNQYDK